MSKPERGCYEFGAFRLDAVERILLRDGRPVLLTQKVFDLLLLLIQNSGHVVEKERLMSEIWPNTFVEEGNLTQNISVLRKVLNDNSHQYIQTVPRRGYRFVGQVRDVLLSDLIIEEHSMARVVVEDNHLVDHFDRQTAVHQESAPLNVRKKSQNTRTILLIAATALVGTVLFGISWRLLGSRNAAAHYPPPFDLSNVTLRKITSTGNIVYGVISADGQFVAYCTLDDDNHYALWLQHAGAKEPLQLIAPGMVVGPAAISHDNNWLYYAQLDPNESLKGSTIYRMPLFGGPPRKVLERVDVFAALSPDDQRILFHRFKETGGIDVLSVNALDGSDEQLIATSNVADDYLGTQWSPDGTRLLFFRLEQKPDGNYWSLNEMPARGGPIKSILPPRQQRIWFAAWADQGRGIVINATDPVTKIPQLYYVSYPDGQMRRITNDLVGYTTVSVGGETVMAGKVERHSPIWVSDWPISGPGREAISRDMADGLSWTPDNHLIYDTNDDGRLHLWTADAAGGTRQQLSPDNADERQPDVAPDGKMIAFISKRSGKAALWLMDADGRNPRQLSGTDLEVWRPRFAPDGQSIFFLMERAERPAIARISLAGGEPAIIADDVYSESFFDISPDGQYIAYTIKDRTLNSERVVVRALSGGAVLSYFNFEPMYFVRWTPDGKNLAYAQLPQDKKKGAALWLQPVKGGLPRQVINFAPDLLYWIAWSRDGKKLALSYGRFETDIVLLRRNSTLARTQE